MTKEIVCKECGYIGAPKRQAKGNILYEIILWCLFILPGVIYTFWRFFVRFDACPKCKSFNVLDKESPMGRKLVRELSVV